MKLRMLPSIRRAWLGLVPAVLVLHGCRLPAGEPAVEVVHLPPLRILGQPARAHTQGLELVAGQFYVTARREDVRPRQALLLRSAPTMTQWDVWDITPVTAGAAAVMDHPGGFQSDGKRLWIPLAESWKNGRSVIRVFALANLVAGQAPRPELEFFVNDHIGALAVNVLDGLVVGASWDTETVYVWDLGGHLQRTLTEAALGARGLGVGTTGTPAGVAIQDWKFAGSRLIASGLSRAPHSDPRESRSRLVSFDEFITSEFHRQVVTLPLQQETEPAREGMVLAEGRVYFLPDDLGASNRVFRMQLSELLPSEP